MTCLVSTAGAGVSFNGCAFGAGVGVGVGVGVGFGVGAVVLEALGPAVVEGLEVKDNLFDPSLLFKTVFILPKTRLNPFFFSLTGTAGVPWAGELIVAGILLISFLSIC